MITDLIFKLKHDIANDSELQLAKLELESLLGEEVQPIRNLVDALICIEPLRTSILKGSSSRIQDIFLRMPYPGIIQAFRTCPTPKQLNMDKIRHLTYFRDVFIIFIGSPEQVINGLKIQLGDFYISEPQVLSPFGQRLSAMVSLHKLHSDAEEYVIRIIPPHCFLECSDHIVRLAQKVDDVDRMYDGMMNHFHNNFFRPFAASVQMGFKWIEDFIDDRRPPNAYASHSLFGLRGRFFPRMARALVNHLVAEKSTAYVVDPFGGVGTLGLECSLLGVLSSSYDINPLFVNLAKAKQHALNLNEQEVAELEELRKFSQELLREPSNNGNGLSQPSLFNQDLEPIKLTIPSTSLRTVNNDAVQLIGLLRAKIAQTCSDENAQVAQLAIAYYADSMLRKYPRDKILKSFWAHLSRILYVDRFMKRLYADNILLPPITSSFEVGDVKNLYEKESNLEAIVTSPPYSTAIDYIGNDLLGYYALGFDNHNEVEKNMIGSTKLGRISSQDSEVWRTYVPSVAKQSHSLVQFAYEKKSHYLAKYFYEMTTAMQEISKSLTHGGKMAMVLCDEQEFGGDLHIRYPIAEAIVEIAEKTELKLENRINIDLTKNGDGDIMRDCALIFSK